MSCDDFVVSRRRFLAGTTALLGGVAVSGMVGDIFTQTAYADPGSSARVGWLNRMIGNLSPDNVVQEGMHIGGNLLPTSLVGPASAVSTRQLADLRLPGGD